MNAGTDSVLPAEGWNQPADICERVPASQPQLEGGARGESWRLAFTFPALMTEQRRIPAPSSRLRHANHRAKSGFVSTGQRRGDRRTWRICSEKRDLGLRSPPSCNYLASFIATPAPFYVQLYVQLSHNSGVCGYEAVLYLCILCCRRRWPAENDHHGSSFLQTAAGFRGRRDTCRDDRSHQTLGLGRRSNPPGTCGDAGERSERARR